MDTKAIKSVEIEIKTHQFQQHKSSISICDVDINKILVSKKVTFGKRCF